MQFLWDPAPKCQHQVVEDEGDSQSQQHLIEGAAEQSPSEDLLQEQAQQSGCNRAANRCQKEIPRELLNTQANVTPKQKERTVAKVQDPHQAKHHREPTCKEKQEGSGGEAV